MRYRCMKGAMIVACNAAYMAAMSGYIAAIMHANMLAYEALICL